MSLTSPYRSLPSVDQVLSDERVRDLSEEISREAVLDLVRSELEAARSDISNGRPPPNVESIVDAVQVKAGERWRWWPTPVINATGVIIHTNLGRAPLSQDAMEAMVKAAAGYSDLELDLATGRRGSRQAYIGNLLSEITGAEAGLVVNNNASAIMLGLAALTQDKDVMVSRGEAVEIGGGFRVPDVLRQSGATLVDVGTTNRTYVRDFEAAVTENTGAFLSVHASNFKVIGFTESPTIDELVELGDKHGVPVLHDLGSGCLLDTTQYGLAHEPMPQESVDAGVDLAFFSGDKLLGGPQAGIVVGKRDPVAKLARHPLARAMRIDKLSMAALTATLLHYVRREAAEKIPVWRMISTSIGALEYRAQRWCTGIGETASVTSGTSAIGGGSLPGETLESRVLSIDGDSVEGGAHGLAERLRKANPPVIARIESDRLVLDPRTVLPDEDDALLAALRQGLEASARV